MKKLFIISITAILFGLTSCEKYEPTYSSSDFYGSEQTKNVSAPTLDCYLTTTDLCSFNIKLRFNNGGDEHRNMSCTLHWRAYSSKPSTTPKESELNKVESMRIIDHTSRKTTFSKEHAGFNGGTYIYYYATCSNSKATVTTPVKFCIIKR